MWSARASRLRQVARRPALGEREQDDVVARGRRCARCSGGAATWSRRRRPGARRCPRSAAARRRGRGRRARRRSRPHSSESAWRSATPSVSCSARARSDAAIAARRSVGQSRRSVRATSRRPATRAGDGRRQPTAVVTTAALIARDAIACSAASGHAPARRRDPEHHRVLGVVVAGLPAVRRRSCPAYFAMKGASAEAGPAVVVDARLGLDGHVGVADGPRCRD